MSLDQNDYNKGGMVAFMFSMVVTLLFFVYVSFFSGGIDLKEVQAKAPEQGAPTQQQAAAPQNIDVSGEKTPWVPNDNLIAHGKQLYVQNCAMCHGAEGKGDGVAGASLNPKPRNLVEGKWKFGGDRVGLFKVLQNGTPGTSMQSYKHMPAVDRWSLVHFIRSITSNKVADNDAEVAKVGPTLQ